jgi:rhamnose utilization protein RhaD (predicted bifunctional aldolase and dehydrogenase)
MIGNATDFKNTSPMPGMKKGCGIEDEVALFHRSNLLGSDLQLTNFGGGNTSL